MDNMAIIGLAIFALLLFWFFRWEDRPRKARESAWQQEDRRKTAEVEAQDRRWERERVAKIEQAERLRRERIEWNDFKAHTTLPQNIVAALEALGHQS
jgi:hypothetical protein